MLTRAPLVGVFVASLVMGLGVSAAVAGPTVAPSPHAQGVELLVVAEDDPWSLALAAPVVARLRQAGCVPLVVAISDPPTHEADWLIGVAGPRRPVVLAPERPMRLGYALEKLSPEVVTIGSDAAEASLRVAKRFWGHSREAVLAAADDPEAVILGSALAAGRALPLVLRQRSETSEAVAAALVELGVGRAWIAVGDPNRAPAWAGGHAAAPSPPAPLPQGERGATAFTAEVLGPRQLQHELVAALGASAVRNLVVARLPEGPNGVGRTAWLAPVVSVARGSPVVLAHAASPAVAEADAAELIRREGLRPRTVLLLADYASLGQHTLEIETGWKQGETAGTGAKPPAATAAQGPVPPPPPTHYEVKTEPFIPRDLAKVVPLGVGRIPLESAADASVLFARGLVRERLLAGRQPRLLLVANAGSTQKPLPLCETVSRVTAEEFKNFGVHVDDFYGKLADSPEIMSLANSANVIIYEGHMAYQDLIDVPFARRTTTPDTYFEEELDQLEGGETEPDPTGAPPPDSEPPRRPEELHPETPPPVRPLVAVPGSHRLQGPLAGLPIVIMQSCDSLDEPLLWRIDELGGVAVIGSMTPIHSASGSALVHAAAGAVLYGGHPGGTRLGEALRDAQNYLLCLEDLKGRRGHKEQAKGRRVAVSFRLWGDPELRFFPGWLGRPAQLPVALDWAGPETLTIHTPAHRLPEARSSKYFAHMFPGSQAAGMVKEVEGDPERRLTPVYYFRVPLRADWPFGGEGAVVPTGVESNRVSLRVDPQGGVLYLVYYPEVERAGQSITLRLDRPRQARRAEGAMP
jgi:hypothetical protein